MYGKQIQTTLFVAALCDSLATQAFTLLNFFNLLGFTATETFFTPSVQPSLAQTHEKNAQNR